MAIFHPGVLTEWWTGIPEGEEKVALAIPEDVSVSGDYGAMRRLGSDVLRGEVLITVPEIPESAISETLQGSFIRLEEFWEALF